MIEVVPGQVWVGSVPKLGDPKPLDPRIRSILHVPGIGIGPAYFAAKAILTMQVGAAPSAVRMYNLAVMFHSVFGATLVCGEWASARALAAALAFGCHGLPSHEAMMAAGVQDGIAKDDLLAWVKGNS